MSAKLQNKTSGALLARLFRLERDNIAPVTAKYFLSLGFTEADKERMHELAVRNQEDRLSRAELEELMDFIRADQLLTILHSKARRALKKAKK
jgi:hypothetical protein